MAQLRILTCFELDSLGAMARWNVISQKVDQTIGSKEEVTRVAQGMAQMTRVVLLYCKL
jgi:hypothetical protein